MKVLATYAVTNDPDAGRTWHDLREANPRARARLKQEGTDADPASVDVMEDGSLVIHGEVEVDRYEGDEHQAIRDEVGQ